MRTSEPLHVAFVWHMHQPYYRSARDGAFGMPWARMHALKDYLDMVDTLSDYPALHQTFNLVPSLVEQLEEYASGAFADVYWEHTLKPASELDPLERIFVVQRMCERPDHPRARSHPRYLELARKRESLASSGWGVCTRAFSIEELRDLQVWFNLAWFDQRTLTADPLRALVEQDRGFREKDKELLAQTQAAILSRTLPAYREAVDRKQIELSTSPYFHPILPLLCDSDSARVASPDVLLPPRRFAHPEDAAEQLRAAVAKHKTVFGEPPRGVWCSEQAVGESVISLLLELGIAWTISDEGVLARSLSGAAARPGAPMGVGPAGVSPYSAYRLVRETGEMAIVFRDRTLSDLIGFTYKSWDSRDAAADLLRRLRELRSTLSVAPAASSGSRSADSDAAASEVSKPLRPLVVIALDGENAWEYYPQDGRDFLERLYEGLSTDDSLHCVTISEHLRDSPPSLVLDWLHTGSWIAADLRTWCGTQAQSQAWDLLHQARDLVVQRRQTPGESPPPLPPLLGRAASDDALAASWHHVLVAEGSDWFWWLGNHHHTELDAVWELNFRLHLQEAYRLLGERMPEDLLRPVTGEASAPRPTLPLGPLTPTIDGALTDPAEWEPAGYLTPDLTSTMQPSEVTRIEEVRFGWHEDRLCLLVVPDPPGLCSGLEMELGLFRAGAQEEPVLHVTLEDAGRVAVNCLRFGPSAETVEAAWKDVVEVSLPFDPSALSVGAQSGLVLRIGRKGTTEHVFHSIGAISIEERVR
jgi:alpha-amylase/alpha-mannosidase (GH57 family)